MWDMQILGAKALSTQTCLVWYVALRRIGGSSGSTSAKITVSQCSSAEDLATADEDFKFQVGQVSWADGDVQDKCAMFLSPLGFQSDGTVASLSILADAEVEKDEVICFGIHEVQGSATVLSSELPQV